MVIVAIVQARIGSTRLPGKVLKKLNGMTVLEHVIHRLKQSKKLDRIIIATTNKPGDDEIEYVARGIEIDVFRGDEHNVLERYLKTAERFGLTDSDTIVRITSDCPLVDPGILDTMIELHEKEKADYTFNNVSKSMLPRGFDVEIVPLIVLKKASSLAERDERKEFYQEHVCKYIADHPEKFRHNCYKPIKCLRRPDIQLSVNTREDLERVRMVLSKIKASGKELSAENIVEFFPKPEIALYSVSSPETGTGHLRRMVTLSKLLQNRIDCNIKFYVNDGDENKSLLKGLDFSLMNLSKDNLKAVFEKNSAALHVIGIPGVNEKFRDDVIIVDKPSDNNDADNEKILNEIIESLIP